MRIRILATVVLAWSLSAGFVQSSAQKPEQSGLPSEAREALKKKWPDWQLASLAAAVTTCQPGGKPAAGIVTADFDSDGHPDFAVAIRTAQAARLVVLTWRPWGFDLYDVDALGDQEAGASIVLAPHGMKFANPRMQMDDYFPSDTLTTRSCDKGANAYFWTGVGFSRMVIPSVGAPLS